MGEYDSLEDNFIFFINCKNYIDQKVVRLACKTSWKPAVHMDIYIQVQGTNSLEQTIARQARSTESKGNRLPCTTENQREQAPLNTEIN